MQQPHLVGTTPQMLFALFDVSVEIGEPFDTHRFKTSDVAQAFHVSRRQSDMYAKLQHVVAKRGPHQILDLA